MDESTLGDFATLSKEVAYFALSAHAPQVSGRATSKFDAWEWVKLHARMYLGALPEASFGRRDVIGGMARAFGRTPLLWVGRSMLCDGRRIFVLNLSLCGRRSRRLV